MSLKYETIEKQILWLFTYFQTEFPQNYLIHPISPVCNVQIKNRKKKYVFYKAEYELKHLSITRN